MIKYICDRCKAESEKSTRAYTKGGNDFDLCEDCEEAFDQYAKRLLEIREGKLLEWLKNESI